MKTTLYDVCKDILAIPPDRRGVTPRDTRTITEGLTPKPITVEPGQIRLLTPEEILSVNINYLTVTDESVDGYQRTLYVTHSRQAAANYALSKYIEPPIVAVDHDGKVWVIDGQHRLVAAVTARVPIVVVIADRVMTQAEMAEVFNQQRLAKPVPRGNSIMSGNTPPSRYFIEAQTNKNHAWYGKFSLKGSKNKIPVTTAHAMAIHYSTGRAHRGRRSANPNLVAETWDARRADELASLLSILEFDGDVAGKAVARSAAALRGITGAALQIIGDDDLRRKIGRSKSADINRWFDHMPSFPWQKNQNLRREKEWERAYIEFWNKKLHEKHKIPLETLNT